MDSLAEIEKEISDGLTCDDAVRIIKTIARLLILRQTDPKRAANDIYWTAWHAAAWSEGGCGKIAGWGSEFLQLADGIDRYGGDTASTQKLQELIHDAADAVLEDRRLPEWRETSGGVERLMSPG